MNAHFYLLENLFMNNTPNVYSVSHWLTPNAGNLLLGVIDLINKNMMFTSYQFYCAIQK